MSFSLSQILVVLAEGGDGNPSTLLVVGAVRAPVDWLRRIRAVPQSDVLHKTTYQLFGVAQWGWHWST